MISNLFNTFFYDPIYNALVALVALIPGGDVGVAVILVTIAIRLLLLPFSLSAARTQYVMKGLEPKLKELKEKHKGNREQEALATLELYRSAQVNPFASILVVLIQIPVLLALYFVFLNEPISTLTLSHLYSITPHPNIVSLSFLGLLLITEKSLVLAFLAGATQFFQAHLALTGTMKPSKEKSGQADFQRIMGLQLKYVFPFLIATISYTTSSAIALYFITTNCMGAVQEWYVRKKLGLKREAPQ